MIIRWWKRRQARECAKLIFQNSAAPSLLPFFKKAYDDGAALSLMVIGRFAKEAAASQKPIGREVAKKLAEDNLKLRNYADTVRRSKNCTLLFDDEFRPPEGWPAFYSRLGL